MENLKEKYGDYLIPALCFSAGMLAGMVLGMILSAAKGGKITLLSNNTVGSGNGCGNSAEDIMIGAKKNGCGNSAEDM